MWKWKLLNFCGSGSKKYATASTFLLKSYLIFSKGQNFEIIFASEELMLRNYRQFSII